MVSMSQSNKQIKEQISVQFNQFKNASTAFAVILFAVTVFSACSTGGAGRSTASEEDSSASQCERNDGRSACKTTRNDALHSYFMNK